MADVKQECGFKTEEECHKVLGVLTVNSFVVHDSEEGNMDLIG